MRHVIVPSPVLLVNLETGVPMPRQFLADGTPEADEPWTIWRFLARFVISDPKIGGNAKGARTIARLRAELEHAMPGSACVVEDADREIVLDILDKPTATWDAASLAVAAQCTSFMAAFTDASEAPPRHPSPVAASADRA